MTHRDVLEDLPAMLRGDLAHGMYSVCIEEAFGGEVTPKDVLVAVVCKHMRSTVHTRSARLSSPGQFCDRVHVLVEGRVSVSRTENKVCHRD